LSQLKSVKMPLQMSLESLALKFRHGTPLHMLEDALSTTMAIQVLHKLQMQPRHGSLTRKVAQVLVDTAPLNQVMLHVYAESDLSNEILNL